MAVADPGRPPQTRSVVPRDTGVIKANSFWAFAYNIAALTLATAGPAELDVANAATVFSSVFVASNSLRLRHLRSSIR
ncbi:hypothetical protein LTT66_12575 [Nocardia gipuzkoensis]|uniref:hypothetical protein n=1 Tax=Nocardia TaxID=1817 RepID=UPI001E48FE7D|nr:MULTISPECIES: hypothetical protein [Nocardia]UGT72474.1 hypothetical protein LTT66_12575 [Nocardia gipuzkoensis]